MSEIWAAPRATGPVRATVAVPGSKSVTNRALVLAALAATPTRLRAPLRARDTELMAQALRSLGAGVEDLAGPDWLVTPLAAGLPGTTAAATHGPVTVDCGLAGTVMRFVPPLAAFSSRLVTFDGDEAARRRPMLPVLQALRDLGVAVDDGGRGTLPFTVRGTGSVAGGAVEVDASASSQFVSALLLAGCRFDEGLEVRSVGGAVPSLPHVDMTLAMLGAAGVRAYASEPGCWRVEPGVPAGGDVRVEPDVSNAFPFAAAALATGGRVTVAGFPARSALQPVGAAREVLEQLGALLTDSAEGLVVDGSGGLRGADLDLSAVGELVPVVAALACLAPAPTTIRGVAHIRGHETDRLAALRKELGQLGADVEETADGLAIKPAPMHGGVFETYDDHRLATAAAVLGLAVDGVGVVNVATTGKTLPGFVGLWTRMLAS